MKSRVVKGVTMQLDPPTYCDFVSLSGLISWQRKFSNHGLFWFVMPKYGLRQIGRGLMATCHLALLNYDKKRPFRLSMSDASGRNREILSTARSNYSG